MTFSIPLVDADKETQALAAAVFLMEQLALDRDQQARIAEYINQRYGAFNAAP